MSLRAVGSNQRIVRLWSLHPLSLVEAIAPQAFGDPLLPFGAGGSWTMALNSGREPFLYSIYLGVGTCGLALLGALVPRSRRAAIFWSAVALVTLVLALGDNAGVYTALQRAVPVLGSVRYPVKYAITTAFAVAILAGFGWDALIAGRERPEFKRSLSVGAGALVATGLLALGLTLWETAAPYSLVARVGALAAAIGADATTAPAIANAAAFVLAPRLVALAFGTALCLKLGEAPERRGLRGLLFGLILVDLLIASANLVPTMDPALLGEPAWVRVAREHPHDRAYFAGRLSSTPNTGAKPDLPFGDNAMPVTENPPAADHAALLVFLDGFPGARQVRDSISYDNSLLFPREYWDVVVRFRDLARDERIRYLRRVGVRYFLVPWDDWPEGAVRMEFLDHAPLRLYEREPEVSRASVVPAARVEPDRGRQLDSLFDAGFEPAAEVVVATEPPAPAGAPGEPCQPTAEIVEDAPHGVTVRACAPEGGGYVVLLDSYDPNWQAEVDGAAAPLLRADGLFRAVRIAPGAHEVRFSYRPRRFWVGVLVSAATAMCLLAVCLVRRRRME
jgi:hypothetical protein